MVQFKYHLQQRVIVTLFIDRRKPLHVGLFNLLHTATGHGQDSNESLATFLESQMTM
jgi:hypothetical protein